MFPHGLSLPPERSGKGRVWAWLPCPPLASTPSRRCSLIVWILLDALNQNLSLSAHAAETKMVTNIEPKAQASAGVVLSKERGSGRRPCWPPPVVLTAQEQPGIEQCTCSIMFTTFTRPHSASADGCMRPSASIPRYSHLLDMASSVSQPTPPTPPSLLSQDRCLNQHPSNHLLSAQTRIHSHTGIHPAQC